MAIREQAKRERLMRDGFCVFENVLDAGTVAKLNAMSEWHGVAPMRPDCRVAGPAFTLRYLPARRVQDGASIVGTYPPIEDTLRAYRESRS